MRFYPLSVLFVFTTGPLRCFAIFAPRWNEVHVKHTWNSVPENWQNLGHPPAGTTTDLHIALKAQDENTLIDTLYEVSSPGNPKYGAHLTREQVAELVAPPSDVLQLVHAWFEHHGVLSSAISTKHGGSWLTLTGIPVSQANELLSASYQLYQHIGTNETVLRTLSYGLPTALLEHVQNVAPTTHFGFTQTPRQEPLMHPDRAPGLHTKVPGGERRTVLSSREEPYITPSALRSLYKTASYVPAAADRNALGVTGYKGKYPNPDDLTLFMETFRTDAIETTYEVVEIKGGGYNPSDPADEANMNVQYTSAIAYPTPHIFYSTGGSATLGDPFINWLDYVLAQESIPQTITTSYSVFEFLVPADYAIHVCNLFSRLGVRGSSVLFSSGNDGVGRGSCQFKDSSGNEHKWFLPTFPSTCPWVTSVGGTTGNPETAASFSGGGFSNYFIRPPYQRTAVPSFLQKLGSQYNGFFNPWGRGVPDIAIQAINFRFVLSGEISTLSGTSCATPAAAGIVSLLNDYRISIGKPPLGYLNMWLYGVCRPGLNDITSGSNPGCDTDGFPAVPGWDPVTGLGSLDFEKLIEILTRW
ncbi:subtilisin-like protein, partial [Lactarius indigo]